MIEIQNPGHSIYFGQYNTWEHFHLFPTKRPYITPPNPVLKMEEVEGMDGVLDYSTVLQDFLMYGDREGTWEFKFIEDEYDEYTWRELYKDLYSKINNRYINKIILEDDPDYYYSGRIYIENFDNNQQDTTITIHYRVEPFKRKVVKETQWLWDDLLETEEIYYGSFTVNGTKRRSFINNSSRYISVDFYCSAPMTITTEGGSKIKLVSGTNLSVLKLKPGYTILDFSGRGVIRADYPLTAKTNSTEKFTWNWDDLLNTQEIYYGKFNVNGTKRRTFINKLNQGAEVSFWCTSNFEMTDDTGKTYYLYQGFNNGTITLDYGKTVLDFKGTGDITATYTLR